MESTTFGQTHSEETATLFTLQNKNGMVAKFTNFGAAITEVHVPDRNGSISDVTLGFDSLKGYLTNDPFFGVVAGRYANRIARGRFRLGNQSYQLAINNGPNHLHGGETGFNRRLWTPAPGNDSRVGIRLTYQSPHLEEGYPGTLSIQIDYTLTDANELKIDYEATTDQSTPLNLTNHAYWNLNGDGAESISDHELQIHAEFYTPVDTTLIPTGEIHQVEDTALDFRNPKPIGERIHQVGGDPSGYDHNYILKKSEFGALELAATVRHPRSGRRMDVFTSEPAIQLYTGNFLDGTLTGKSGKKYLNQSGFCLECQHFPDSPNHPHFPSTILHSGQVYKQSTIYQFSVED